MLQIVSIKILELVKIREDKGDKARTYSLDN